MSIWFMAWTVYYMHYSYMYIYTRKENRRYMAKILSIRGKTLFNLSFNQSSNQSINQSKIEPKWTNQQVSETDKSLRQLLHNLIFLLLCQSIHLALWNHYISNSRSIVHVFVWSKSLTFAQTLMYLFIRSSYTPKPFAIKIWHRQIKQLTVDRVFMITTSKNAINPKWNQISAPILIYHD